MISADKSPLIDRWFRGYNRRYLQKSFQRIHLDGDLSGLRGDGKTPLLLCLNHSSWWDLLLGLYLSEHLPDWDMYGVMDERQLRRYRFFSRLGVIGVERETLRGAREFLAYTRTLLTGQPRALCLTPQGEFVSNSVRPVRFQPGIGAIAGQLESFLFTTIVLDYEFWSEKQPEAFISVRPVEYIVVDSDFDRRTFVHRLERQMEQHLDAFTAMRVQRDPALFQTLLDGQNSISPVYNTLRRASAWLRREPPALSHQDIITPPWKEAEKR